MDGGLLKRKHNDIYESHTMVPITNERQFKKLRISEEYKNNKSSVIKENTNQMKDFKFN